MVQDITDKVRPRARAREFSMRRSTLFGERGLEGATVRDIAARAKVNVAAISYHFGGKDELYRAVAGMVIGSIEARVRSRVARILDEPPRDPESALLALENLAETMIDVIVGPRGDAARRALHHSRADAADVRLRDPVRRDGTPARGGDAIDGDGGRPRPEWPETRCSACSWFSGRCCFCGWPKRPSLRRMEIERYDEAFLARSESGCPTERARHGRRRAGGTDYERASSFSRPLPRRRVQRSAPTDLPGLCRGRVRRRCARGRRSDRRARRGARRQRRRWATSSSASTPPRRSAPSIRPRRRRRAPRLSSRTCSAASARRRSPSSRRRSPRRRPRLRPRASEFERQQVLFDAEASSRRRGSTRRARPSRWPRRGSRRPSDERDVAAHAGAHRRRSPPAERAVDAARAALEQAEDAAPEIRRRRARRRAASRTSITSSAKWRPPARRCSRCSPHGARR